MNKVIKVVKENKFIHYFVIALIGIIISIPIFKISLPETHDGIVHMLRILGTYDTISTGQIPVIIEPDFCNGMGYAINLFYPPLVTYIPLIFKLILPSYAMSLKVFGMICIIFSGITMYNFVYQVTKNRLIALFSGFFYIIAPYKLGNVYKRYAIGEFTALIFLPILFQGMHSLFCEDGKKHYYIAIGATLLILSHTITTFYTAILCAIFILFYINKLLNFKIVKKILINCIFIVAISLLFIGPLLEAKQSANYVIFDSTLMVTNSEYLHNGTIKISEFLIDEVKQLSDKKISTTFIIGIPIFMLILLSPIVIFIMNKKEKYKKLKDIHIIFLILGIFCLYMATKYFPWLIMPNFLCKLQYPWRMIGFFNFFSSLVCALNLYIIVEILIEKKYIRNIVWCLFLISSLIYTIPLVTRYSAESLKNEEIIETNILSNPKINHMRINREYLPTRCLLLQHTYMQTREDRTYILNGSAEIIKEEKDKLNMNVEVKNISKDTILEFPYIFYPGYVVTIENDNKEVKYKGIESENGYLALEINDDIDYAKIKIKYEHTIITKVCYGISIISLIIFIIYIVFENRKKQENNLNETKNN